MTQAKVATLERLYDRRPTAQAMAFSALVGRSLAWSGARRSIFAVAAGVVGLSAIVVYVIAVNVIFLNGQAMRRSEDLRNALLRDTANLEQSIFLAQSPAWLERESRSNGMIAVGTLRYVSHDQSLARTR